MGLFDGAFGDPGNGILPDWLFNPNPLANVGAGDMVYGRQASGALPFSDRWSPEISFNDRFGGVSAMPQMQSAADSPRTVADMLGGQTFPGGNLPMPQARPAAADTAYNRTLITPGLELPPEATPTVGTLPQGNPLAALFSSLPSFTGSAQAAPQGGPGSLDRLGAGFAGFANSGGPLPAIANLIGGIVTGKRQDPYGQAQEMQQRAGQSALNYIQNSADIDPALKGALAQNPELALQYLQARIKGTTGTSSDIAEYEYAKRQGAKGSFEDWMKAKRMAGAPKAGLTPVMDADGNIFQLTTDGELIKPKGAENFKINKGVELKDTGTHWQPVDRVTGKEIGKPIPKNIEEKEAAEERGKARGQAQTELPRLENNANQALKTIEQIRSHPGLKYAVGFTGIVPPIAGTSQRGAIALINQAKGKAFLEAFNSLKGGGAISEAEGAKATDALVRLDRAQTMDDFQAALKDFEDVIQAGIGVARQKAGKQAPVSPGAPPKVDLKKKYGLD